MKPKKGSEEEDPLGHAAELEDDGDLTDSDTESVGLSPAVEAQIAKKQANRDAFNDFLLRESNSDRASQSFDDSLTAKTYEPPGRIIDDPRDYQTELFEKAKTDNVIAVLHTGSGKTLIAALLMRHVANQEIEDRANGKLPRMSFFLVNSVLLVRQQSRMLANNLPIPPQALHGNSKEDLWVKSEWDRLKEKNNAIVCTAEVLNQALMHRYITIAEINLIVFDEAHNARKGHPYARIIKDYYMARDDATLRPKIFGMTASPVNVGHDVIKAVT